MKDSAQTGASRTIADLFTCTQCGFCCHGETTVSLDEADQRRMIDVLGLSEAEVRQSFWNVTGFSVQMKTVDGHCIFYREGCSVYRGRPWRCAQWPLVPALAADENNYLIIRDSCPGINRSLPFTEARAILVRYFAGLKKPAA